MVTRLRLCETRKTYRETYHVPKPASFHTHTLLLTPTDYVTRFGIYSYRYTHSTAPAGYPTASAGFQASAAHSASAGQHLSPTQQLRYAPIPATKSEYTARTQHDKAHRSSHQALPSNPRVSTV